MIEKIAHITDLHLDEYFPFKDKITTRKRLDYIINDIKKNNIQHIVCTGDIGEGDGVSYFFKKIETFNTSVTLGNHDNFFEISKYYKTGVNFDSKKIYKSQEYISFKIIYLDSSSGVIDEKQLIWLKKELKTAKPIIIFIHHPIIKLDLKVDEIGKLINRKNLIEILTQVKNEITIYCGHYHIESTSFYKNLKQFITPAVAFQIKKDLNKIEIDKTISGYRIIQIENTNLTSKINLFDHAD
ncbi:metallophosphoesterase family protein [Aureivirga sp. CE67]|uniref:metallophosphoesterase family protein n=1 Tax=Aureivirga sp. CE67 TaxID=1788983 RepID=UPI0018C9DF25|nr:metallophosphoesterase [Aureivirga sp. CE67]